MKAFKTFCERRTFMSLDLTFEIDLEEVLRLMGAAGTKEQSVQNLACLLYTSRCV